MEGEERNRRLHKYSWGGVGQIHYRPCWQPELNYILDWMVFQQHLLMIQTQHGLFASKLYQGVVVMACRWVRGQLCQQESKHRVKELVGGRELQLSV